MADYIDRDTLIKKIRRMPRTINPDLVQYSLVKVVISNIEQADVVPVVHGKWINEGPYSSVGGDWMKLQECSVCHAVYTSHGNTPWSNHKYCPNCGAKMDL